MTENLEKLLRQLGETADGNPQSADEQIARLTEWLRHATPEQKRARENDAISAELGLDAYALGTELLELDRPGQAVHWLQEAVDHGIYPAARTLANAKTRLAQHEARTPGIAQPAGETKSHGTG